jgi:protein phosphatase
MQWNVSAATDLGCCREHNEDLLLLGDAILGGRHGWLAFGLEFFGDEAPYLLGVADGLGGHKAGAVASRRVLEALQRYVWSLPRSLSGEKLRLLLERHAQSIHEDLIEEGRRRPHHQGLGATLVGVLFYEERMYALSAGDSRLYRLRSGKLRQLTEDHTLAREMNDPTVNTSIIVNSFGGGDTVSLDFAPILGSLGTSDALLLCSDGVSDVLSDEQLTALLNGRAEALDLIDEAKRQGSTDNLSAIVARVA